MKECNVTEAILFAHEYIKTIYDHMNNMILIYKSVGPNVCAALFYCSTPSAFHIVFNTNTTRALRPIFNDCAILTHTL